MKKRHGAWMRHAPQKPNCCRTAGQKHHDEAPPPPSSQTRRRRFPSSDMRSPFLVRRHRTSSVVAGPFVFDQVLDLRGMEPGPEVLAEVAGARAAGQEGMDAGAVVADVVADQSLAPATDTVRCSARRTRRRPRRGRPRRGGGASRVQAGRSKPSGPASRSTGLLGEPAAGGDLAAVHREHGRGAVVEVEHVVAGDLARVARSIVEQGADAGVRPDDVAGGNGVLEVRVGRGAEVVHLPRRDRDRPRPALDLHLGGSEQGVLLLEGDRGTVPGRPRPGRCRDAGARTASRRRCGCPSRASRRASCRRRPGT